MTRPIPHPHRGDRLSQGPGGCRDTGFGPSRAARASGRVARIPLALGVTAGRLHRLADRQSGVLDPRAVARVAEIGRPAPALTPEARAVIERARLVARNWKDLP